MGKDKKNGSILKSEPGSGSGTSLIAPAVENDNDNNSNVGSQIQNPLVSSSKNAPLMSRTGRPRRGASKLSAEVKGGGEGTPIKDEEKNVFL